MTKRDLAWRLAGLVLLGGSGVSGLPAHRLMATQARQPASPAEMALTLVSFALAGVGALLILYGVRLRDGWRSRRARIADARTERPRDAILATAPPRVASLLMDPFATSPGRVAMAAWLVHRTLSGPAPADRPGAGGRSRPRPRHRQHARS